MRSSSSLATVAVVAFVLPLAACSSSSDATPAAPADSAVAEVAVDGAGTETSVDASADASDSGVVVDAPSEVALDAPAEAGGSGSGTISGSVKGATFDTVMSSYWIGTPDDPATIAVYLIGKPITCAEISKSGWSHTIPASTQVFEMIMTGSAAGTYKVSTANPPPAGEAEVQYIFAQPTKNETRANAGTITLGTLTPKSEAIGSFSVQFPDGTSKLDGTFDAVYCPTGHEP